MDPQQIAQAFANTLDPIKRAEAENYLEHVYLNSQFTPCLLQIVMNNELNIGIRQSASIYLKNMVNKYWKMRDGSDPNDLYVIPEESKVILRENMIEGIIQTPPIINKQLCVCLETIVRQDFPDKWTGIIHKCHNYITSDNQMMWLGALLSIYQLSKKYKFKKIDEKVPYIKAMKTMLQLLYNRMISILPHQTEFYVTLQHWILKILYCTIHYDLPFDLIESGLSGWIIIFQTIIDRPIPQEYEKEDEEERSETEWWKCKKWTMHILCNIFERFASPASVTEQYSSFANYYMKTFNCNTTGIINTLLKQLEKHRHGLYLTSRVKQLIFNYLNEAINYSLSWKVIRPHFQGLFTDIIFPLLCYSAEDDQLWHDDPYEYIRMKFDIFEDLVSPAVAVQVFLAECCQKRRDILDPVMAYCVQILNEPADKRDPSRKDGALNVIGTTSDILMKRKFYKPQLEPMLVAHVFPEFKSPLGYMRARACWMIHYFSEITYTDENNLQYALQEVLNCLTNDAELPVKVEAAVALQYLIKHQTLAEQVIKPYVKLIITQLLQIIKDTDNDDLTEVLQEIIETYYDCIIDIAVELCSELAASFTGLLEASGGEEEDGYKALTALGLISAVQALVKSAFSKPELLKQMENALINTIASIFQNGVMDYYEEMLTILDLFTCESVSPMMWQMFGIIYEAFERDGFDYFSEMMDVVYNFIRIDTQTFLSNPKHIEIVISMSKTVLSADSGEEPQVYACKLLEVLLLECHGKVDQYIPNILEGPLERLTKHIQDPDLRFACVLVVVAGLYTNCVLTIELLEKTKFSSSPEPITAQFFTQWLQDCQNYEGIHDRKISVLGLCSILQCPVRPTAIQNSVVHILPMIFHQLELLVSAYKKEAEAEEEEEEDEEEEVEVENEDAEDDGEVDDEEDFTNKKNPLLAKAKMVDDDDEDDDPYCLAQTILEIDYQTCIDDEDEVDEYCAFKDTIQEIQNSDPEWFAQVTSCVNEELAMKLQVIFVTADQRRAAMESRKREVQGGYNFTVTKVPHSFTFTSPQ